jgi:hypothetical protein
MVLYAYMCCVCVFLLHQKFPDLILGDKPLISKVVLSHFHLSLLRQQRCVLDYYAPTSSP